MKIGNVEIKNPVILGPMAGVTNICYRSICKEFGASLVCSEMVSDKAILYNNQKTMDMLGVDENERPLSIQVFGSSADTISEAAKIIVELTHCDIIDINMGCPVKKVFKTGAGSALLADPKKIYDIVKATVDAVDVPVTAKIRIGIDHKNINAVEVAKMIELAGASAIAVHGRTRTDMYSGKADLDVIKAVKDAVSIPVIGNGDIFSYKDAIRMIEYTGVDGVMVSRGALGNPWIFKQISDYFEGKEVNENISFEERERVMIEHYKLLKEYKNDKIALLEMRSHMAWYVKGLKHNSVFRRELNNVVDEQGLLKLLEDYKRLLESD